MEIQSLYCKKIKVNHVIEGQYCSIGIGPVEKEQIRKGMVLIDHEIPPKAYRIFEAEIWNIAEKEQKITLSKTQLVISIGHIRQKATFHRLKPDESPDLKEDDEILLKYEEPVYLRVEFMFNSEFLNVGDQILVYESSFKLYGQITKLLHKLEL